LKIALNSSKNGKLISTLATLFSVALEYAVYLQTHIFPEFFVK